MLRADHRQQNYSVVADGAPQPAVRGTLRVDIANEAGEDIAWLRSPHAIRRVPCRTSRFATEETP